MSRRRKSRRKRKSRRSRVKSYLVRVGRKALLVRSARKPRVLRVVNRQTGSVKSISRDRIRRAMAPGKRMSRFGKIYYEYRRNRSDRPGRRT